MLFLISLLAVLLTAPLLCFALRRAPVPCRLASALLASAAAVIAELDPESAFLRTWVLPLFTKGAMAAALWALVMFTGALPGGSRVLKKLLTVRGELSILAAILTLAHAVFRGVFYIRQLLRPRFHPGWEFLVTCAVGLALLLIMLPLTVLSFRGVRRRVDPRRWKRIQRFAYLFYGLIFVHVLVLYLPSALRGSGGYGFPLLLYSAVWLTYLALRLRKHVSEKTREG
jgi:DMSO/TMAO reductase YedYZ heme-binding membrane subunit